MTTLLIVIGIWIALGLLTAPLLGRLFKIGASMDREPQSKLHNGKLPF